MFASYISINAWLWMYSVIGTTLQWHTRTPPAQSRPHGSFRQVRRLCPQHQVSPFWSHHCGVWRCPSDMLWWECPVWSSELSSHCENAADNERRYSFIVRRQPSVSYVGFLDTEIMHEVREWNYLESVQVKTWGNPSLSPFSRIQRDYRSHTFLTTFLLLSQVIFAAEIMLQIQMNSISKDRRDFWSPICEVSIVTHTWQEKAPPDSLLAVSTYQLSSLKYFHQSIRLAENHTYSQTDLL